MSSNPDAFHGLPRYPDVEPAQRPVDPREGRLRRYLVEAAPFAAFGLWMAIESEQYPHSSFLFTPVLVIASSVLFCRFDVTLAGGVILFSLFAYPLKPSRLTLVVSLLAVLVWMLAGLLLRDFSWKPGGTG